MRRVPPGSVTTYGALARAAGCGSARAVGRALGRHPRAPDTPCHRVIASDLGIGGFEGGASGPSIAKKRELLAAEGVLFREGKLADPDRLFLFDQPYMSNTPAGVM